MPITPAFAHPLERVQSLYAAALECHRDAFEGLVRSLHRGASKSQRAEIARFHSNLQGTPPGTTQMLGSLPLGVSENLMV